jgi:hypothetical protein
MSNTSATRAISTSIADSSTVPEVMSSPLWVCAIAANAAESIPSRSAASLACSPMFTNRASEVAFV